MVSWYHYRRGSKGTETYEKVKKDIETLLTSRERITDEHSWSIYEYSEHYSYFHFFTMPKLKKWCLEDPNDEGRLNLFLNETEYFQWWDQWYNGGTGIYTKYHFYYNALFNGGISEFDPFYDPILSKGGKNSVSTLHFGGFTKKEIMDDYFIRDGKKYGLLDIIKKFYGVHDYEEIHGKMMSFAKNQMIYLEEDIPTSFDSSDPDPIIISPNPPQAANKFKSIVGTIKEMFDNFKDKNENTPPQPQILALPAKKSPKSGVKMSQLKKEANIFSNIQVKFLSTLYGGINSVDVKEIIKKVFNNLYIYQRTGDYIKDFSEFLDKIITESDVATRFIHSYVNADGNEKDIYEKTIFNGMASGEKQVFNAYAHSISGFPNNPKHSKVRDIFDKTVNKDTTKTSIIKPDGEILILDNEVGIQANNANDIADAVDKLVLAKTSIHKFTPSLIADYTTAPLEDTEDESSVKEDNNIIIEEKDISVIEEEVQLVEENEEEVLLTGTDDENNKSDMQDDEETQLIEEGENEQEEALLIKAEDNESNEQDNKTLDCTTTAPAIAISNISGESEPTIIVPPPQNTVKSKAKMFSKDKLFEKAIVQTSPGNPYFENKESGKNISEPLVLEALSHEEGENLEYINQVQKFNSDFTGFFNALYRSYSSCLKVKMEEEVRKIFFSHFEELWGNNKRISTLQEQYEFDVNLIEDIVDIPKYLELPAVKEWLQNTNPPSGEIYHKGLDAVKEINISFINLINYRIDPKFDTLELALKRMHQFMRWPENNLNSSISKKDLKELYPDMPIDSVMEGFMENNYVISITKSNNTEKDNILEALVFLGNKVQYDKCIYIIPTVTSVKSSGRKGVTKGTKTTFTFTPKYVINAYGNPIIEDRSLVEVRYPTNSTGKSRPIFNKKNIVDFLNNGFSEIKN